MKNNELSFFILLILLTFNSGSMAQCVSDTNKIYKFTTLGKNYEVVKENKTWILASACAVSRGGILTEIYSQQQQDSIFNYINLAGIVANNTVAPDGGGASYLWIGGNDFAIEGDWVWDGDNSATTTQFWQGTSSGSAVGGLYNNWGNEPDDYNGQDALGLALTDWPLGVAGQWNDIKRTNNLYYIIEYPATSTGLIQNKIDLDFEIYPNPAKNNLTVNVSNYIQLPNANVSIYNLLGELLYSLRITQMTQELDVSILNNGIYFVQIESDIYTSKLHKVVVNH